MNFKILMFLIKMDKDKVIFTKTQYEKIMTKIEGTHVVQILKSDEAPAFFWDWKPHTSTSLLCFVSAKTGVPIILEGPIRKNTLYFYGDIGFLMSDGVLFLEKTPASPQKIRTFNYSLEDGIKITFEEMLKCNNSKEESMAIN